MMAEVGATIRKIIVVNSHSVCLIEITTENYHFRSSLYQIFYSLSEGNILEVLLLPAAHGQSEQTETVVVN